MNEVIERETEKNYFYYDVGAIKRFYGITGDHPQNRGLEYSNLDFPSNELSLKRICNRILNENNR